MIIMDGKPVFIKIDEYNDVVELLNTIKSKIDDAKETLAKVNQLRADESTELDAWKSELEEVEKNIVKIDKELFEK